MSTTRSMSRKNLSLKCLKREHNTKDENDVMANKRIRTDTMDVLKHNAFTEACMQVSYEASQDLKKRFQLLYLPECKDKICSHGDKNVTINQMSPSAEVNFKIEMKSNSWYEALEVCILCISPYQYLSANVLKDVVEIILNAQEDVNAGFTADYILRKCQQTLQFQFNMHPPCISKCIRDCYKDFLTSPMDPKYDTLSNRDQYLCNEGIVSHCIDRLVYEISIESKDETLIDIKVPEDIDKGVKTLHWKKENLELFEFLVRTERIERLMLILEIIIELLQTDLALWNSRCGLESQTRSQKPLLAYVLWPHVSNNGKVTNLCRKILELFAYFIHLQYPEQHIKVMSMWMNTVVQMFYIYGNPSNKDYPNTSDSILSSQVSLKINHILSSLPTKSVLKILERIQPAFMQYIVGVDYVYNDHKIENNNIIVFIISCIKEATWKKYCNGGSVITLPKFHIKTRVKPHKLLNYLTDRCKTFKPNTKDKNAKTNNEVTNTFPKLEQKEYKNAIQRNEFINILFITLVAYLEAYDIKTFKHTYNHLQLENNLQCLKEWNASSYKNYTVSAEFVKKYRSIVKSLQELIEIIENKNDELSKNLLNLLKSYCS